MTQPGLCSKCGVALPPDAPGGICPRCVLELGWGNVRAGSAASGSAANGPRPTTARSEPFASPQPADLAAHFPQLEILELLGQGGMGAVYKARQRGLDRLVAVKVLPPEVGRDPAFAERFTREARALARLSHPNIVGIHDVGQAGEFYYFSMEFVDGANLRRLMQDGALTSAQALAIVPQICEALQYAHDEGIVHRDIKPENILVDKKGRVKIADFGLAKLLGAAANVSQLTGTYQVMGTFHYMAPEQFEKPLEVDHRADIYSLGVVLYELLTHELPIGRFALPSQKVEVDVRLDEVVLRALEKEPPRRYQHASDVKTDVETIVRSAASKPPIAQAPVGTVPVAAAPVMATLAGKTLSVPVAVHHLWQGLAEGHGLIRCDGEELLLEYDVRENVIHTLRLGSYIATLPLADLVTLTFKPGWWGHTLKLQASRLQAIAHLPGSERGQIKLTLKAEDRAAAERLAEAVKLRQAGESWESALEKAEALPVTPAVAPHEGREAADDDVGPARPNGNKAIAAAVIGIVFWIAASLLLLLAMRSTHQNSPQFHSQFWSGFGLLIAGGACLASALAVRLKSRRPAMNRAKLDPQSALLQRAKEQVLAPARGLWLAALLDAISFAALLAGVCYLAWEFGPPPSMTWAYAVALLLVRHSFAPLQLAAATRMRRLENGRLANLGAVVALVPGTPGWLLGLPMGIWALVVMRRQTVAETFADCDVRIPPARRAAIALSILATSGLMFAFVVWSYFTLPSEASAAGHAGKWISHNTAAPRLTDAFITRVELRPAQVQAINDILEASYVRYRALESGSAYVKKRESKPWRTTKTGEQSVSVSGTDWEFRIQVRPFATRRAMLESSTWRQIDLVLDQRQRGLAHQCDLFSDAFLAGRSQVSVELRSSQALNNPDATGITQTYYHWSIERKSWFSGVKLGASGGTLPKDLQPFWDQAFLPQS